MDNCVVITIGQTFMKKQTQCVSTSMTRRCIPQKESKEAFPFCLKNDQIHL